jgi:DNA-binding protein YbaB
MAWDPTGLRWDDVCAQLEELAGDYGDRLVQLRQLQAQADRVTAVARSRDELVSVMVGAQGQLLGVDLKTAAYDRLSPQRLAAAVVELAAAAAVDAAEKVRQIMAPVLPAGWEPGGDAAELGPSGLSLLDGGVTARWW